MKYILTIMFSALLIFVEVKVFNGLILFSDYPILSLLINAGMIFWVYTTIALNDVEQNDQYVRDTDLARNIGISNEVHRSTLRR